MTIIVVNGLSELTTVLTLISVLTRSSVNESKTQETKTTTSGKKRGRPRKVVETPKPETNLVETPDTIAWNKCIEHRTPSGRKQRTVPTFRTEFFTTKEDAMNFCLKANLPYTRIMKIRPTRAIVGEKFEYPCYYYIRCATRTLKEITIAARHQYIEMWNARHRFKLPTAISISISSKQVFKKKKN